MERKASESKALVNESLKNFLMKKIQNGMNIQYQAFSI